MKKIAIILAALAAAFAVSCTKETPETQTPQDSTVPAGMKLVTISASIEGADTKTSYDADGKFSWTKGDQISVYCSDGEFHTLTAESDGAKATFSGYIPEDVSLNWCAFYPAYEGHKVVDGNYFYSLPEYKDLTLTNSADLPMGAVYSEGSYAFMHMSGAALLTFTNIPDGVNSVEISIKNSAHVISGTFQTWANNPWSYVYAGASNESEKTFIRKVSVINNQAQVYLPFKGQMWSTNTINIKGYDTENNELILLKDKVMKGRSEDFKPGVVVPYKPLALPDYVPAVDWTKVDWTAENVHHYVLPENASSSRQVLREVKYFADAYYLYINLSASIEKLAATSTEKLTFAFFDKTNGSGAGLWGWWGDAKGDIQYVAEGKAVISGTDLSVSIADGVNKEIDGDMVTWTFAIPRSTHEVFHSSSVYLGIMSQKGSDATGALPDKYASMLEVTLP